MNKQILIILTAFSFWSIQCTEGLGRDILPLVALLGNVQLQQPAQGPLTSEEQIKKQEKNREQQLKRAEKAAFKRQQKANQPNSKGQHQGCKHNRGAAGSWYK